jgi:hypothetical protein
MHYIYSILDGSNSRLQLDSDEEKTDSVEVIYSEVFLRYYFRFFCYISEINEVVLCSSYFLLLSKVK